MALLGQPDAVAALTVAQAQHPGTGSEQPGLPLQEVVGTVAVDEVRVPVSLVPVLRAHSNIAARAPGRGASSVAGLGGDLVFGEDLVAGGHGRLVELKSRLPPVRRRRRTHAQAGHEEISRLARTQRADEPSASPASSHEAPAGDALQQLRVHDEQVCTGNLRRPGSRRRLRLLVGAATNNGRNSSPDSAPPPSTVPQVVDPRRHDALEQLQVGADDHQVLDRELLVCGVQDSRAEPPPAPSTSSASVDNGARMRAYAGGAGLEGPGRACPGPTCRASSLGLSAAIGTRRGSAPRRPRMSA